LILILKVEARNAEVELALTKLKTEEASLRDQQAKMQAVNEGLAQDKIDLHQHISEVRFFFYSIFIQPHQVMILHPILVQKSPNYFSQDF